MREIDFNPTAEYPTTSLAACIREGFREVTRDDPDAETVTLDEVASACPGPGGTYPNPEVETWFRGFTEEAQITPGSNVYARLLRLELLRQAARLLKLSPEHRRVSKFYFSLENHLSALIGEVLHDAGGDELIDTLTRSRGPVEYGTEHSVPGYLAAANDRVAGSVLSALHSA